MTGVAEVNGNDRTPSVLAGIREQVSRKRRSQLELAGVYVLIMFVVMLFDLSSLILFAAFIGCYMFTFHNWRCPVCQVQLGANLWAKRCGYCGTELGDGHETL